MRLVLVAGLLALPSIPMAAPLTQHEVQKLLASGGATYDSFGWSVALSGDTAVIGAEGDDDNGNGSGAAYVFTRDASGTWSEQAKLQASDGATGHDFGRSVAISGDTAVIGGWFYDGTGSGRGAAYVYTRGAGGVWSEQAKLLASDGGAGSSFGGSVAVSGDTVVIGARLDDDLGVYSGSAYVFTRNAGGVWLQGAKLLASDATGYEFFGHSVAVSSDTAVIGAPELEGGSGSAYVYTRIASGVWAEQAKLVASDAGGLEHLGQSVDVSGATAVVGAGDGRGAAYDAAYVYTRNASGVWSEQAKLLANDAGNYDLFGNSVAISGDTAVVGAMSDDDNGIVSGSAYVYTRNASGVWSQQAKLLASDGAPVDQLGWSVAVSDDTAMIGAIKDDDNGDLSGSAYVYKLDLGRASATLQCPGDINGDDVAELVVATATGRVRVKDLTGAWVNGFDLPGPTAVVDTELMADTSTNGAAELVLLQAGDAGAQVRDLLTSARLGSVAFDRGPSPVELEIVTDQTGNGIPEFARLGQNPVTVEVRDGLTAEPVNSAAFANYEVPQDLEIYPDTSGNGWPELAVLGDNKLSYGADKIEIRDPATGAIVRQIWLGKYWRALEQALLADLNGNGSDEVAVLRHEVAMDRVNVWIRDTATRASVNFIGFNGNYLPQKLLTLPDINGNGADEVAVFGRRANGHDQKVVIKDSRTGEKLNGIWFDRNFPNRDFVSCGDINGNGAQELAFLGQRVRDGRYKVVVKDSKTGERLALVWWL